MDIKKEVKRLLIIELEDLSERITKEIKQKLDKKYKIGDWFIDNEDNIYLLTLTDKHNGVFTVGLVNVVDGYFRSSPKPLRGNRFTMQDIKAISGGWGEIYAYSEPLKNRHFRSKNGNNQ